MAKYTSSAQSLSEGKTISPNLEQQRAYVRRKEADNFDFSLVVADAFVRGIRDIGYKNTATALDELVDNALQAEAENIHVVFGFDKQSDAKPTQIAVIDDGHGMDPEMIRLAILWGGTHRENDRTGFGRYGYGLPSASVSQGKRFEVYSFPEGGQPHVVALDVDDISSGKYTDSQNRIVAPKPVPGKIPSWLTAYIQEHFGRSGFTHGTIVVLQKLDQNRLTWTTAKGLETNLLQHFGVVYRNFLRQVNIYVEGKKVEAIDPLFITPGFRFFDIDSDRADPLEPMSIEVKDSDTKKSLGTIRVRYAYLPPGFGAVPEDKGRPDARGAKHNPRFSVMREYNGILVLRNARQIDVVNSECPWTTFQNNDRHVKVEIDFPATLDEEFSITTSKQQIGISDKIWDQLEKAGVYQAIQNMRKRYVEDKAKLEATQDQATGDQKRPSELAMEDADKFIRRPIETTTHREEKGHQRFQEEVQKRAQESRQPIEQVAKVLELEIQGHPYKVEHERVPGAPFFRVEQIGGQKVLYLNQAHRFYTQVYAGPDTSPRLRAALEILLFAIGDCELDAKPEIQAFYLAERAEWSKRLELTLDRLEQFVNAANMPDDDMIVQGARNQNDGGDQAKLPLGA